MPAHAPLRWGIVGFGWVAQDFFVPALREAGDRLLAIFDPDPRAREIARTLNARACDTLDELADDRDVDAVYVATPNHLHRVAVEALASAGKAILCEKPMAASLAEAQAMAAACRSAGTFYRTAFDQRHHPAHTYLRDAVRAGEIGTPTAVRIVYACWVGPDWTGGAARENWRIDRGKAGGGALIDLAPHGLDLASFILDERIEAVSAWTQRRVHTYGVDDGAVLTGRFANDMLLQMHVAYNCPESLPRRRLEIVGSEGMFVAENTMGQTAGGRVTHVDGRTGQSTRRPIPEADVSPFLNQVRAFGRDCRARVCSAATLAHDLHLVELTEQAYRSAASASV